MDQKVNQLLIDCNTMDEVSDVCAEIESFFKAESLNYHSSQRKFSLNENVGIFIRDIIKTFSSSNNAFPIKITAYVSNSGAQLTLFSKAINPKRIDKKVKELKAQQDPLRDNVQDANGTHYLRRVVKDYHSVELNIADKNVAIIDFPFNISIISNNDLEF